MTRRYRLGRPIDVKKACWDDYDMNPTNGYAHGPIVEYAEGDWEPTGLLGPTGEPVMAFVGPEPLGFLWHDEEGCLRQRHELLPSD